RRWGESLAQGRRRARREPCRTAMVLERHDVSAAAARVGANRLPVGCGDNDDEQRDHSCDRKSVVEVPGAGEEQDEQNLFCRVGARRERVRGEDGKCLEFRQALLCDPRSRERTPENDALYRLYEPLDAPSRPAPDLGGGKKTRAR